MSDVTPQKFRYLAVLDFEATCDDQAKLLPQKSSSFQSADSARNCGFFASIPIVWTQVLEFLRTNSLDETNTLFVTCGHWDLFKMLPSQLKTSKLGRAPPVLSQWCNIKAALKDYSGRDIRGMFDMLKYFNLPLIGWYHSGIDDARNIAAVARSMLKFGYVFDVTPEYGGAPFRPRILERSGRGSHPYQSQGDRSVSFSGDRGAGSSSFDREERGYGQDRNTHQSRIKDRSPPRRR
ncbi:hypothetical protein BCR33DRAFT_847179 [Rhizoclosmatium globosum]|uniref:Exonuclease domain-containing protein n=1 Tax=Rhizoclosmatium globosum TaxID=329046 RepID=A0A1Y2CSB3_9FUNG|nr:hypothetical protein BCR33DRAFT_847179 [Rhizoclosmatium globosum]|eukprot:ORY49928.1 hypothetical protein BCR33DRAFT_847179 [Rhizoclosmatium globosum]